MIRVISLNHRSVGLAVLCDVLGDDSLILMTPLHPPMRAAACQSLKRLRGSDVFNAFFLGAIGSACRV